MEHIAHLENDGFAVVPNVLPGNIVQELIEAMETALKRNSENGSHHTMRHLVQSVPAIRELSESTMVKNLVEPFLGPDCFVVRSLFFDKTASANWKVPWHQDLTIAVNKKLDAPGFTAWSVKDGVVHVQPPKDLLERMLTVRLHLDDCHSGNGPLQVIPSSHKSGRLDADAIIQWRKRQPAKTCAVGRGGAILMRPLLLHASSQADSPHHRRVVHLEFAAEQLPDGLNWDARTGHN